MTASSLIEKIRNGNLNSKLSALYPPGEINTQVERYCSLLAKMAGSYPGDEVLLFSTPGRTEISGNHTDHNHGRVIAAGIHLDSIAAVAPTDENIITLVSEGYRSPFIIDLSLPDVQENETGTTSSLIRGIAARLARKGFNTGGFRGFLTSDVLPGSGLSSSASIEVLICTIFNHLFNQGAVQPLEMAQICQYAENVYFGKPCGLMDQAACALGGIAGIDFKDPAAVAVEKLMFNFQEQGYTLVVVNSGGSHADLTHAYAAIPGEMRSIAEVLGQCVCREVTYSDFLRNILLLREKTGDRAILRYIHFYNENKRVEQQIQCLKSGNIQTYLKLVKASGDSSWRLLQNCYEPSDPAEQGISLALAMTEEFLDSQGAARVHGGGFAGTIQAYIPSTRLNDYIQYMEPVFGEKTVIPLQIRAEGSIAVI